jgi:hypothetical protein
MTAMLGAVAPLAVLLEGGYNLAATAAGCEATLRVLLGQRLPHFAKPTVPSTPAMLALQQVVHVQVRALATTGRGIPYAYRFSCHDREMHSFVQVPALVARGRGIRCTEGGRHGDPTTYLLKSNGHDE